MCSFGSLGCLVSLVRNYLSVGTDSYGWGILLVLLGDNDLGSHWCWLVHHWRRLHWHLMAVHRSLHWLHRHRRWHHWLLHWLAISWLRRQRWIRAWGAVHWSLRHSWSHLRSVDWWDTSHHWSDRWWNYRLPMDHRYLGCTHYWLLGFLNISELTRVFARHLELT